MPVTTYRLGPANLPCGGGVYFRALPYGVTAWLFERLRGRAEPIVFYLHPWELDAGQPRISMAWALRARHYCRLRQTAGKLRRLCRDFAFEPIGRAMATWDG